MSITQCPHPNVTSTGRVCRHLLGTKDMDYCKRFTGIGIEYDLICVACRANPDAIEANLLTVCSQCFAETEAEGWWDAIIGQPQSLERPGNLSFSHDTVDLA